MAEPSSPVDWDILNEELDGQEDWKEAVYDSLSDSVQRFMSPRPNGAVGRLQEQRDKIEERACYCSDEELPKPNLTASMSVFKDVLRDSLQQSAPDRQSNPPAQRARKAPTFGEDIERFSALRIKDRMVSSAEINSTLSELRFVRLPAIKTAMMCEKVTGSWATVGIIVEKGMPKVSSQGKNYVMWKLGTLEKAPVTLFLFGTAYTEHWKEPLGTMLAILNAGVRPDVKSKGPCLSIFNRDQAMKLGVSADYRICSGKRKDGTPCSMVLNKHSQGLFCQYHATAAQYEFRTSRPELHGGKLSLVGPGVRRGYPTKTGRSPIKDKVFRRPLKHMTTTELKDLLSNAEKMPAKTYSQGKRFLEVVAQRTSGVKESSKKAVKRENSEEATKARKRSVWREFCRTPLAEKQMNVKMNGKSSGSKQMPQTSIFKAKSKVEGLVMELDTVDDLDD